MPRKPYTHSAAWQALMKLQADVAADANDERDEFVSEDERGQSIWETVEYATRLEIAPVTQGFQLTYYGRGTASQDSPAFATLLDGLCDQALADWIEGLTFVGPDEGANGSREWCFTPLVDSDATFPRLNALHIPPSDRAAHNTVCIVREGEILDEAGDIARFVGKSPQLTHLTLPEAPSSSFFSVPLPKLQRLVIGPGHDTRGFIAGLASAALLPSLGQLDFSDSVAPLLQFAPAADEPGATPFEDYEALFHSPLMEHLWGVVLRNAQLTEAQYRQLRALRPNCQFQVTHAFPACYVSHWNERGFPWRHLLLKG